VLEEIIFTYADKGESIVRALSDNVTRVWEYWQVPRTQLFFAVRQEQVVANIKAALIEMTMVQSKVARSQAELFCDLHPDFSYRF
jgi:hypothetical protein